MARRLSFEAVTGATLVAALALFAAFGVILAGHDPDRIDVAQRFASPTATHWFGTDQLGRDLFARAAIGARVALAVALSATFIAAMLGSALGTLAAFAPAAVCRLIMEIFDTLGAFPSLILALAIIAATGPGTVTVVVVAILTMTPQFGRVARAQSLSVRRAPYIDAARLLGASRVRIMALHVLPNIAGPILVLAGMDVAGVITIESALSFLGQGVRPPLPSWGTLLRDGYQYLDRTAWPMITIAILLALATLGFTFLGEALRNAIDPKLDPDRR
ncbi:MAG TPA: ABC transporter permease [Stellaceae bacterium]|nr:ABC transporter permease [Stellaceae bacterium]